MDDEDYECMGEMIDGVWSGCGCEDCREAEGKAIEEDYEMGSITYGEAMNRHALNDA